MYNDFTIYKCIVCMGEGLIFQICTTVKKLMAALDSQVLSVVQLIFLFVSRHYCSLQSSSK